MTVAFATAAPAQRNVLDQLPPDAEAASFRSVAFFDGWTPVTLPGEGAITGLARQGGVLWVRRADNLLAVAWPGCQLQRTLPVPADTLGLAADERCLYLLRGRELVVLDPAAGETVRTLPLRSATRPAAFAVHGNSVQFADDTRLRTVDLVTGAIGAERRCEGHLLQWLAHDGTRLLGGDGVDAMDVAAGVALRRWPGLVRRSAAAWVDGQLLLSAAIAVDGNTVKELLGLVRIEPGSTPPLVVRVFGTGAELRCDFRARTFTRLDDMQTALRALAADPRARQPGPDGRSRPPRVELVAQGGVRVGELKAVWQAVVTSGMPDVRCPAQEAWLLDQVPRR